MYSTSFAVNSDSLSPFEVAPQACVANRVDTTSGMYFEEEEDYTLASIEDVILRRYYSSNWEEWRFFPHCTLLQGNDKRLHKDVALTFDSNGTEFRLISEDSKSSQYQFNFKTPLQNLSRGSSSGRAHFSDCFGSLHHKLFKLTLPDGTLRTYEEISSSKRDLGPLCSLVNSDNMKSKIYFRLISERLSTGNTLLFGYEKEGFLHSIQLTDKNQKSYAEIRFQYDKDQVQVCVNDKEVASYQFDNGLLTQVTRSQKPNIFYSYKSINDKRRLIKKELPEGCTLYCSYDEQGKVHALANSAHEAPIYRFQYGVNKTEVIDCNSNKTIFHYLDRLLTCSEFYENERLQRKDTFIWNALDKSRVHTLRGYTLQDGRGRVIQGIRYEYEKNDKSRIVHQDIYKAAGDDHAKMIRLDGEGLPLGNEKTRQSNYFSLDRPWHLRYQEDEHGNRISYHYAATSNRIEEKFVEKEEKICQREFYEYDDTGAVIKAIVDDGRHEAAKNLSGVNARFTRKIKPRNYRTMSEEKIEEWRYDPHTEIDYLVQTIKQSFDADGNIIKRELYDTEGEKAKTEEFAFDVHGNCIRQVNALGEATHYRFDANDNCIQIEAPGLVTTFAYDLANQPVSTKECYSDGATLTTRQVFDELGNQIASIDRYGNQTEFAYDAFGRCTSIVYPRIEVTGDNLSWSPKESFQYDLLGHCILKTNPNGHKESILYNSNGQKHSIGYPDSTAEHFYYNTQGKLKQKLNKNGTLTMFRYDRKNNLSAIETNALTAQKKRGKSLTCIQFDYSKGRCIEEQESNGQTIVKTYDVYGRLQSETEKSSKSKTEYKYDTLHRPIRIKRWIDDKEYLVECFTYDVQDRIVEKWIKEPNGSVSERACYRYDAFGNVTTTITDVGTEQIQYIEGRRPHLITNVFGGTTRIEYNESRNTLGQHHLQLCITDPKGVVTVIDYDALGRKVSETIKDPFGVIISCQKMLYDAIGNLEVAEVALLPRTENACFEWTYGPMNQLESLKDANHFIENTFNDQGELSRMTSQIAGNRSSFSYEYTQVGMEEAKVQKICKDSKEIASFIYDKAGNVIGGTCDGKGMTKREYTPQGKIASETISDEWGSYTVEYEYDRLGRMIKVRLPDKSSIRYDYLGSILQDVIRMTKDGKEAYCHEFIRYNEKGLPIEEQLFIKEKKTRTYCLSGALSALVAPGFSESIIERDSIGNPTKIQRNTKTVSYAYDYLGRLIEEKGDHTQNYAYDSLNNVLTHNNAKASYNKRNQLLQKGPQTYAYDHSDNLIEMRSDGSQVHLGYTANNQLNSYVDAHDEVEYRWDVYGRRTLRKEHKSIHRMFFIGNCEIGALNKDGEIIELKVPERIIGEEAQGAIAIELKKHTYLPISDLLGNIAALYCPRTKRIVESYEYTAFGQERIFDENSKEHSRSPLSNPWRYRAHRTDPTTHFVCFGFRDYDPATQRFLTPDPLGYIDGFNSYAYVLNNPIVYSDVYGLKARYGACTCHPTSCEYYTTGICGHGGGVLFDDDDNDTEQERVLSELDNTASSNIWRIIDDGLDAWDTASNATILAGASSSPFCGAGLPVLGCGVALKLTGRVAKVSIPMIKIVVPTIKRFGTRVFRHMNTAANLSGKIGATASRGAESVNAGKALVSKLKNLEEFQQTAAHIRILADGRTRYYKVERKAINPGKTRGASMVTEFNPKTGQTRSWNECYDHFGNVNRVHPKTINGQEISSIHYPPIASELLP